MKIACLYHNDSDGFGAAFALWKALKATNELMFIEVQYGQEPPYEALRGFALIESTSWTSRIRRRS